MIYPAVAVLCLVAVVSAYPNGPTMDSCGHMFPTGHHSDAQTGAPYFTITVDKTTYTAGGTISVTLTATSNYYEGIFVQARSTNCSDATPVGTFTIPANDDFLQTMSCSNIPNSAVAHKTKSHVTSKTVTWTAPSQTAGQIFFRGTFVKNEKTFWTDIFSPVIRPSGDSTTLGKTCDVRTTLNSGHRFTVSVWLATFLMLLVVKCC